MGNYCFRLKNAMTCSLLPFTKWLATVTKPNLVPDSVANCKQQEAKVTFRRGNLKQDLTDPKPKIDETLFIYYCLKNRIKIAMIEHFRGHLIDRLHPNSSPFFWIDKCVFSHKKCYCFFWKSSTSVQITWSLSKMIIWREEKLMTDVH